MPLCAKRRGIQMSTTSNSTFRGYFTQQCLDSPDYHTLLEGMRGLGAEKSWFALGSSLFSRGKLNQDTSLPWSSVWSNWSWSRWRDTIRTWSLPAATHNPWLCHEFSSSSPPLAVNMIVAWKQSLQQIRLSWPFSSFFRENKFLFLQSLSFRPKSSCHTDKLIVL